MLAREATTATVGIKALFEQLRTALMATTGTPPHVRLGLTDCYQNGQIAPKTMAACPYVVAEIRVGKDGVSIDAGILHAILQLSLYNPSYDANLDLAEAIWPVVEGLGVIYLAANRWQGWRREGQYQIHMPSQPDEVNPHIDRLDLTFHLRETHDQP